MGDFIPSAEAELVTFAKNYKVKLDTNGPALGLTPAEIALQKIPCDNIIDGVANFGIAKTTYDGASTTKTTAINTSVNAIRNSAKDIKRNSGYTEAMGREFGIISSTPVFNPSIYKSQLKVEGHPGYVTVKFTKHGVEGIDLYGRLNGELDWAKLGSYTHSPCVDKRPLKNPGQPENREYMCIGLMKDKQIGLESDIVSVAFAG